jgi:CPA1 family monovalent cation:H+ antiporter
VLVLAAFGVVAGTLLVQGSTLPALVRALRLPAPDPAQDALAVASAMQAAARAGLARLDELSDGVSGEVVERLRQRPTDRANSAWERLGANPAAETPSAAYRRLRIEMLAAERGELVRQRRLGVLDEEVLRTAQRELDLEESLLELDDEMGGRSDAGELRSASRTSCAHLDDRWPDLGPVMQMVCQQCLRDGTTWVHLRRCLACGTVGCCDSSSGRHAERHHRESNHPVMRSIEPGESWRWCYVDEMLG